MIPAGYMYKKVANKPAGFDVDGVERIYSVSGCISDDFCDWFNQWKHNGYWFFDAPHLMREIAQQKGIDLTGMTLFFYKVFGYQWNDDDKLWDVFGPEESFPTQVALPRSTKLEGFDVVTYSAGSGAEHSPLSCNYLAKKLHVNANCLLNTFEEAKDHIEAGTLSHGEPGPYRIIEVHLVEGEHRAI